MNDIPLTAPVIMCLSKGQGIGVQVLIAATTALRDSEHCVACVPRTHCDRYNRINPVQPKEVL